MKILIFLIFSIILSTSFCFANDLQLPIQTWNYMPQTEYNRVLKRQERLENPDFIHFPGWQDMEIVRHEKAKKKLIDQINVNLWNDDVSIDSIRDLVLQAFDIRTVDIVRHCGGYVIVPFVIDIHYRENDFNGFVSGTINSFGILRIITNKGMVTNIKILKFDDSYILERFGRKIGMIDQYDLSFIESIIFPLLRNYLSSDKNKDQLLELIESFQKTTYC